MLNKLSRITFVILVSLGIVACGGDYTIDSPEDGSLHQSAPDVKVGYSSAPTTLPKMLLNGVSVANLFTMDATHALGTGNKLKKHLVEGNNLFHVNPPLGPKVNFIYDTKGPEIVITKANKANGVTIEGIVRDVSGATVAKVNDTVITMDSAGYFTVETPESNTYTFTATDTLNHSSTITFADHQLLENQMLHVSINKQGFEFISQELVTLINENEDLLNGNGINIGSFLGFEAWVESISVNAESISIAPKLQNTPGGKLAFDGSFSDIAFTVKTKWPRLLGGRTVTRIWGFDSATFNGEGGVSFNMQGGNNNINANVSTLTIDADGAYIDGPIDIGENIKNWIWDKIYNLAEDQIINFLKNQLNDFLAERFADLIPDSYNVDVLCRTDALAADFEIRNVTSSDDMLRVDLKGGLLPGNISSAVPTPLGHLYINKNLPSPFFGEGDMSFAINANTVNQALTSLYAAGLTHFMLLGDEKWLNIPRDDTLGTNGSVRHLVDNLAPPQLTISEVDGEFAGTLIIPRIKIHSQIKQNDEWNELFSAVLNAKIAANIDIEDGNKLAINFKGSPIVDIEQTVILDSTQVNPMTVNVLVDRAMDLIMGVISSSLSGIEIPSIEGYALNADTIKAIGNTKQHLGISGSLSKDPECTGDDCDGDGDGDDDDDELDIQCFP